MGDNGPRWASTIAWITVLLVHAALIGFVARQPAHQGLSNPAAGPLVMVSIPPTPKTLAIVSFPVQLLPVGPVVPTLPPFAGIAIADGADPVVTARSGGVTTPPRPAETQSVSASEFSRGSGLRQGTGATVVLRVEVRSTGTVGRVEVDVSGGNRRVDQAAIAYVRAMQWVGGRVDDRPETLWIRWGVRLDG
jgi:TonB family protein